MAEMIFECFGDLPHIKVAEDGPLNDSYALSAYAGDMDSCWTPIDTTSASARSFHDSESDRSAHLLNMKMRLSTLESSANGFQQYPSFHGWCHRSDRPNLGYQYEPRDIYPIGRHSRYHSPNGTHGGDRSATEESSPSEGSWSPMTSRIQVNSYGQHGYYDAYRSPGSDILYSEGLGSFAPGIGSYFSLNTAHSQSQNAEAVTLSCRDVQHYPDPDPDPENVEDESTIRVEGGFDQDYRPHLRLATGDDRRDYDEALGDSLDEDNSVKEDGYYDEDSQSDYSPNKRHRRQLSGASRQVGLKSPTKGRNQPGRTFCNPAKISKRGKPPSPKQPFKKGPNSSRDMQTPARAFVCSFSHYGCGSTFGSKNEWKRHVASQHLQLGFYRCDVGNCNPSTNHKNKAAQSSQSAKSHNDFNRKDLFTQHQRRMHAPWSAASKQPPAHVKEEFEKGLEEVRQRCWEDKRQPPQRSVCGFCDKLFDGPQSWEDRMEHVGKHFEKGETGEKEDDELREWASQEGLIKKVGQDRWILSTLKIEDTLPVGEEDDDADGDEE